LKLLSIGAKFYWVFLWVNEIKPDRKF